MTFNILAALNDANPTRGAKRCKVQTILDDIPADTEGKDQLAAAALDTTFAATRLTMTFSALQTPVSADVISDHRANRCACYR